MVCRQHTRRIQHCNECIRSPLRKSLGRLVDIDRVGAQ